MPTSPTRRDSLKHLVAGAGAGLGTAALAAAPASAAKPKLDLSDPIKAFEARIKIMGSLKNEPVTSFMRLNVYGDPHNGNFVPLFTMNNLLIDRWERVAEDHFILTKFEAGYYTKFDSDEVIETWDNPFTGETVDVFNFQLGPVMREYKPDEIIAMAYAPDPLPIEVIGDRVFLATQSMGQSPSAFTKAEYPIEAGDGDIGYLNSFMTWSANVDDVANPDIVSAPVHMQIQNKLPWAPWMRMRGRPGGTSLRGFGTKIESVDALPKDIYAGFQKYVPDILKPDQWEYTIFETFHYLEYLEEQKAKAGKG